MQRQKSREIVSVRIREREKKRLQNSKIENPREAEREWHIVKQRSSEIERERGKETT